MQTPGFGRVSHVAARLSARLRSTGSQRFGTLADYAAGVAEWYTQLTQNQPGVTP